MVKDSSNQFGLTVQIGLGRPCMVKDSSNQLGLTVQIEKVFFVFHNLFYACSKLKAFISAEGEITFVCEHLMARKSKYCMRSSYV